MRHSKQVKLVIPSNEKEKVKKLAALKNMDTAGYVRYLLYDAIKNNRIMDSTPTMKSDTFLKFKAPIELIEHIKQQAQLSNISIGSYIRTLIHESSSNQEVRDEL